MLSNAVMMQIFANFFFVWPFCCCYSSLPSPSVSLPCQWSVASVHGERVGGVARLVDVSLLEAAKLRPCCCEKPLHAVKHRLVQDTARHRSQGRFPLWGKTLTHPWKETRTSSYAWTNGFSSVFTFSFLISESSDGLSIIKIFMWGKMFVVILIQVFQVETIK